LKKLDDAERGRLFAFTRLLDTRDSVAYTKASPSGRAAQEQAFWGRVLPLWSRKGDDPQSEFIARVVYAELRWTVDELGVRGADSDRGEIYIRYGPPTFIAAVRGCYWDITPELADDCEMRKPAFVGRSGDPAETALPGRSDVVTYWDYDNGLAVVFWGQPTYGTAHFPRIDAPHLARTIERRTASFDNLSLGKILDMPIAVTRSRASGDSVDVLILTEAPAARIRDVIPNATVRTDDWLFSRDGNDEFRDSTALSPSGIARASFRLPPSTYLYRIEVTAQGTSVAGRAMRWFVADRDTATGFTIKGFGMSDLLLASVVQPNKAVPVRWRDFNVAPVVESVSRKNKLEVIWENYDLGTRGGQSAYTVTATLERQRSGTGRIAASVLNVAAALLRVDRRDDRLTFSFDRQGPAAPSAFADRVIFAFDETPSGTYKLTLAITDKISGRKTARSASVVVRD
jgi:GWxTD domain-containing protein